MSQQLPNAESPNDRSLRERLAAVTLPKVAVDRDRLMYEAGWRAANSRKPVGSAWKTSAILSMAASFALAVTLIREWQAAPTFATVPPSVESPSHMSDEVAPTEATDPPPTMLVETDELPRPASPVFSIAAWWPTATPAHPIRTETLTVMGSRMARPDGSIDVLMSNVAAETATTYETTSPASARELLGEMLEDGTWGS